MRIESVRRRILGMLLDQMQVPVEFRDTARSVAFRSTHQRDQKASLRHSLELVRYRRQGRVRSGHELRHVRVGNIKEEDLLLSFVDAEQSSTGNDSAIARNTDVMRLVAHGVRRGEWDGSDDFPVVLRMFVEVHDREKIRTGTRLVPGTDE